VSGRSGILRQKVVNFGMRAGQKRWFKIVLAIFLVIFFLKIPRDSGPLLVVLL